MAKPTDLRMEVVMEGPYERLPVPWPIAGVPPLGFVRLWGGAAPDVVGLAVAHAVHYNGVSLEGTARDVLRRMTNAEAWGIPGGVRVTDGSGNEVLPGCCSGVENWREWLALEDGASPWMGHDPDGWVEERREGFLVCSGRCGCGPPDPPVVESRVLIPRADLPHLLAGLQNDVRGFGERVREWAVRLDPEAGEQFARGFAAQMVDPLPPRIPG